ncbi:MAG: TRAP transporter small permease [Candidatus Accumulibacter sp.]|jgi:TRAP-type C4-dicarboxylate transport system permease small subunit|nr:TRAP transporter small permease [Accumulibacter sp.]
MRGFLDRLYRVSGWLAGLCTVGVLVSVMAGILARQLGTNIPGTDAYAGYFMAGAGFLALASAFKHGDHIRVTLILKALPPGVSRRLDIFSLGVGAVLSAAFAFYSVKLVRDSWLFNDISTGIDATPLWIPQITMAVGAALFFVAIVDELVLRLRGVSAAAKE